jgi:hypothetical protein
MINDRVMTLATPRGQNFTTHTSSRIKIAVSAGSEFELCLRNLAVHEVLRIACGKTVTQEGGEEHVKAARVAESLEVSR